MKRMKLLATGGAGSIGSITVEQQVRRGHEVIVFDNLYQGHRAAVHPDAVFKTLPIAESSRIAPGSPYGEGKQYVERVRYWLEKTDGLRFACLRYFNAAGASEERGEDHTPEMHLIPLVLQVALGKRESIAIFGEGFSVKEVIEVAREITGHAIPARIQARRAGDPRTHSSKPLRWLLPSRSWASGSWMPDRPSPALS